ncbi:MAG: ABC transporter substrate-binding protein [Myxococcales bacterium]
MAAVAREALRSLFVLGFLAACQSGGSAGQKPAPAPTPLPAVDLVIGNNFGHLPMFVAAEKGFFKNHGVDVRLKIVNTGTDMVTAMQKREVQAGDMSVTTFLKARHAGDPFRVIGIIQSDATRTNADEPLAIVARSGSGIEGGKIESLKGKRIGLAKGQTSDEYFKMVLARQKIAYADMEIVDIRSPFELAPALAAGKVDATVSWEPYNTTVLEKVPESYVVLRGGGHLSYVMVATTHAESIETNPQIVRGVVGGLAQGSQYTRKHRDEAVEIFAKWVPGFDVAVGKKAIQHIRYDPRMSDPVLQAFENAEDDVLKNTLRGAQRLDVREQFAPAFLAEVQKAHPEYFDDLPPLPVASR